MTGFIWICHTGTCTKKLLENDKNYFLRELFGCNTTYPDGRRVEILSPLALSGRLYMSAAPSHLTHLDPQALLEYCSGYS